MFNRRWSSSPVAIMHSHHSPFISIGGKSHLMLEMAICGLSAHRHVRGYANGILHLGYWRAKRALDGVASNFASDLLPVQSEESRLVSCRHQVAFILPTV